MAGNRKRLVVFGGRGALGQTVIQHFKELNVWIASVDHGDNDMADVNIQINSPELTTATLQAQWIEQKLIEALKTETGENGRVLDGIICVAGGWAGGNILSENFLPSVESMWKQSVESSAVAAYLAGKLLKEKGMLVLTGAQAALGPTPSMIGYGMAKASVHHLVKSLAYEGSGLPKDSVVVGILPRTLDTPNNRKFATGTEDFTSWTPLYHVTRLIESWWGSTNTTITSGSLAEIVTKNGSTTVEIH